jgi:hypothetical protein
MADGATDSNFQQRHTHRLGADAGPLRLKLQAKPPIKKTIVPVIYIPGIFGSRLEKLGEKDDERKFVWDPDRKLALAGHYAKSITPLVAKRYWSDKEISNKAARLHGSAGVMTGHDEDGTKAVLARIKSSGALFRLKSLQAQAISRAGACGGCHLRPKSDDELVREEYDRRARRGWYGVWNSYLPLLETVNELPDPEFIYPVFAFGYDWRFDLDQAADRLVAKVNEVLAIQNYEDVGERGKDYDKIHPKVIVVTHSQGSLVARYAMKVKGAEGSVEAVIHMDQPTTGAPVLYHRFVTGTAPERSFFSTENVFSEILGNNPYHFTRMASPLTGALCLLPTNEYASQPGEQKYAWLRTNDPRLVLDKPITDVYEDVYKSEKWGLINCKRYDQAGNPRPYQEKEFEEVMYEQPVPSAAGAVTVRVPRSTFGNGPLPTGAITYIPEDNLYRRDNHRLRPHDGLDRETRKKARDHWKEFTKNIDKAKSFHAALKLDQHKTTHVVRSTGLKTVTQVTFQLNTKGELECPLVRPENGDGTVPLTSQEVLIESGAKEAGPVITGGVHSEICTHPQAVRQVTDLLRGTLVTALRTEPQTKRA